MIDFKLNELGDIELEEQKKIKPFKMSFTTSPDHKKFRIKFKTRTFQKPKSKKGLKINFYTDLNNTDKNTKKVSIVRDGEELSQSIAIRLKTELNELQNFFADFGSELSRMRHQDLLLKSNHNRITEYVENAVSDILGKQEFNISIDRPTDAEGNFKLETLKIAISDNNGKIIYTYTI